jgi:hypothetical protein
MKQATNANGITMPNASASNSNSVVTIFLYMLLIAVIAVPFTACQKGANNVDDSAPANARSSNMMGNAVFSYAGLPQQTTWELQQARAATAKYKSLSKAIEDGYQDINVIAPNMGYHYMKPSLVDGNFDYSQPEILVYNKGENNEYNLVAVEYAVPLNLQRPQGFSGTLDVWDGNAGFQLWLLHAWVWQHNPLGVFNPTNPDVHVH